MENGPQAADSQKIAGVERRIREVTAALDETSKTLQRYSAEVQSLRAELEALRTEGAALPASGDRDIMPVIEPTTAEGNEAGGSLDALRALHDEQVAQQAEIKQLDQTKAEVSSKYPLRISGLVLFNAFANAGVVDNAELPSVALYRYPGSSHGSNGATLRQTKLAFEAFGPLFAGARTSAELSVDFFGGSSANASGYSASDGTLRMRQAKASMDWERTTVSAGYTEPLISPLSPSSYATVAEPSLSGSGNLWTWAPQFSIEHRVSLSDSRIVALEAGIIYPTSPGYTSLQLVSPVEASRRPAYEGRISYRTAGFSSDSINHVVLGLSGYHGRQLYSGSTLINSWAIAGDWDVSITHRAELSGEIYRGQAIGGLGGGAYKDILSGLDMSTGLPRIAPVDAAGGWSQIKVRVINNFEVNAMFGVDDALSRSFDGLILDPTVNPLASYARNRSIIGNLIYRPRTYLVFSPEYRRILSWRYTGSANIANIFTISAGYQF
ncbi:MAG TPA: hypothetical protein VGD64_16475 [Acidisarcina sp.]